MSNDDTCGHPTADGSPCQHPATDGDSCWLNEHGGDAAPSGRDFSLGEDDHDDILAAAREGLSKSGCARAAGVSHTELNRYLDAHDEFRAAFRRARSEGEHRLVKGALYREVNNPEPRREMDGQHARFLLSTSFDYIKTEKKEVEMDADVDHTGGVTADFIAFSEAEDGDE